MEESKPISVRVMFPRYNFKTFLFGIIDIEPRDMVVEQIKREIAYREFSKLFDNLREDSYSSSSDEEEEEEEEGGEVCERPRPALRKTRRRRDPPPRVSRRYSQVSPPIYLRHRFLPQSRKDSSSRRQR